MRLRLFNFMAGVSLLLSVATVALWARSYWHLDDVRLFPNPQRFWLLRSADGRLHLQQTWASGPFWQGFRTEYVSGQLGSAVYSNLPFQWRIAGFGYGQLTVPSGTNLTLTAHVYLMPHAFAAMVFAIVPALWLGARLRHRTRRARLAADLCARCGYDLRASSERCPQCGTVAKSPRNTPMQRTATASRGAVV